MWSTQYQHQTTMLFFQLLNVYNICLTFPLKEGFYEEFTKSVYCFYWLHFVQTNLLFLIILDHFFKTRWYRLFNFPNQVFLPNSHNFLRIHKLLSQIPILFIIPQVLISLPSSLRTQRQALHKESHLFPFDIGTNHHIIFDLATKIKQPIFLKQSYLILIFLPRQVHLNKWLYCNNISQIMILLEIYYFHYFWLCFSVCCRRTIIHATIVIVIVIVVIMIVFY